MDIQGWDERYRSQAAAPVEAPPTKLLAETARGLKVGTALDLACGTGRNALWLAREGWEVTAIDGSAAAIGILEQSSQEVGIALTARVADLTAAEFTLPEAQWDLIAICYYLQRDLMRRAQRAIKPGGVLLVIVHTTEGDEEPTASRLRPGELAAFFEDWEVLHRYEGKPDDPEHKRSVEEIVARRPR